MSSDSDPASEGFYDDRPKCRECGEHITDWAVFVRKGYWTGSEFDDTPLENYWCKDCYHQHRQRESAARYEITDHDQLWDILNAANGDLVADTYPLTVGSRGFVRIVDGELQALKVKLVPKEPEVIQSEIEVVDTFDQEAFESLFSVAGDRDDDPPRIVYLKPSDETPFADVEVLPAQQSELSDLSHD
jgi:hypothetical protein